jgi:hypothetical protein
MPRLAGNDGLDELPPAARIADALGADAGVWRTDGAAAISVALLRRILSLAARTLAFDEAYYLAANPDVRDLYQAGEIVIPQRHFVETGYFEGRLPGPPAFDEAFYLASYPDIRAAVAAGQIASGWAHFSGQGLREGRVGHPHGHGAAQGWAELPGGAAAG